MDRLVQMLGRIMESECRPHPERKLKIDSVDPSVATFLESRIPVRTGIAELLQRLEDAGVSGHAELRLRGVEDTHYVVIDIKSQIPDDDLLELVETVTLNFDPCFAEKLAGTVVVAEGIREAA